MLYRRMKTRKKEFRAYSVLSVADAFQNMVERKGDPSIEKRLQLWSQWDTIMGSPVIDLGFPIETKGKSIIMGAENALAMQELSMLSPTILNRVNSFLGETNAYTRVVLTQANHPPRLAMSVKKQAATTQPDTMPPPPKGFGHRLDNFSDDSIVSRCYRALHAAYFPQEPK